ncbi:fumarylacetoacetase [Xylaria venustula]|nr:fumarylacetoacetase [Xylaria venustula]
MDRIEHFSLANLPFGIASDRTHTKSVVTRLEDNVFFLSDLELRCDPHMRDAISQPTLNALAAKSKFELRLLRTHLQPFLSDRNNVDKHGIHIDKVSLYLPIEVRGYTEYCCSKEHAENTSLAWYGEPLIPPDFPPFPMGYSGHPSSVTLSGTEIRRPCGLYRAGDSTEYAVCKELDYGLEIACIIGKPSKLGEPVKLQDADDHIFGMVLLNNWCARDMGGHEGMGSGLLHAKSFATTISPWVMTLDALKHYEVEPRRRDEPVPPYLQDVKIKPNYKITLEASLLSQGHTTKICKSSTDCLYWTVRDLVAQQTANGCRINTGDLLATGTVSGKGENGHGCLLEMTQAGKVEFELSDGQTRTYLQDGDTLQMTGSNGTS